MALKMEYTQRTPMIGVDRAIYQRDRMLEGGTNKGIFIYWKP
jgi:hypothetical protein